MSKLAEDYYAKHGHYPEQAGAKTEGPSHDAARSIDARALRETVLADLKERGPSTADECAKRLGRNVLAIRPRFSELVALGTIVDAGERRRNASRRFATVWRAC